MRKFYWLPLLAVASALESPCFAADRNGRVERPVLGTVVAIDADRSLITLRPSNLFGRLRMNLSSYRVKRPIVLNGLQPGDRVTALLSGAEGMPGADRMLYRLRRVRNCQVYEGKK